jgi:hypothetical protein
LRSFYGNILGVIASDPLDVLRTFRQRLYASFRQRSDALFELADAAITSGPVPSLAHLSLEDIHRRGWGSLYAALSQGKIDYDALRSELVRHPLTDGQAIYAVDTSVWPRCDAETSPDRGFYYHPSRHSNGKPIVPGWSYQWIAGLSFQRDSWTAPVDVQRVHPTNDANANAVEQIKALVRRLPSTDQTVPLFVFDAGYDPVKLALGLGDTRAAILVRLRSDRCFYADPVGYVGNGRPRRHGAKFVCQDPSTWPEPTDEHTCEDPQYGQVRVRAWEGLHSVVKLHQSLGSRGPRPIVRGTVILVEVSKLPGQTRKPRTLWLFWYGPGKPDLGVIWRAYVRRFDLEHTLRLFKQTLNWTVPRVRLPEQADRWTWLVLLAYTQLRLVRDWVSDKHLPWERPLHTGNLTPCRVRRAFPSALMVLDSPADAPKPSGRSPGRPKGRRSGQATLCPVLKKTA